MKQIYLITVMVLFSLQARAQYFEQYFDGADTSDYNSVKVEIETDSQNVWQIGPPQKTLFYSASTVPNAIITDTLITYPANDTSRFITKVAIWETWGIFALQWNQKIDMDAGNDGGMIEFSIDAGSTWENCINNPYVYNFYGFDPENIDTLPGGEFAFSGTDTSWRNIWLCFDYSWLWDFMGGDTVMFRYTFISDSVDNNRDGWMIDNLINQITWVHTIATPELHAYLNVFPNPSNDIITVQLAKRNEYHLIENMELIDQTGKVVATWSHIPTKFWFDTRQFPGGMYLLKVKSNIKTETIPIVIAGK